VSAVARAVEVTAEPAVDPQTAPHDEMVSVIEELIARSSDNSVSIDTLANALKSRGFRRPPGSPRLITRLRRIRQITIDRAGRITLVGDADAGPRAPDSPPESHQEAPDSPPESHEEPAEPNWNRAVPPVDEPDDEPMPGNVREPGGEGPPAGDTPQDPARRRRRSRRGGRGRRRGRSAASAAP